MAARRESGLEGHFKLHSSATCERIRLACSDQFTQQVCEKLVKVDMFAWQSGFSLRFVLELTNSVKDAKRWTIEA